MKASSKSITEVLAQENVTFFIPPFQRSYAWGKEEVKRLCDDVKKIIDAYRQSIRQEHFFGTLVLKEQISGENQKVFVVVDGQQRLTTSLLFLIALRDSLFDDEAKIEITSEFLTSRANTNPHQIRVKLKQVTDDSQAFVALIEGKRANSGTILDAYSLFSAFISEENITREEAEKALGSLNVAVIELESDSWRGEDPQIIFETLNSLGKPLTLADLVRNFILLGLDAEQQTEIYENKWFPKLEHILKDKSSEFLRDFLVYKKAQAVKAVNAANAKAIYYEYVTYIKAKYRTTVDFVEEILPYVPLYYYIVTESYPEELTQDVTTSRRIKELLRNVFHDIKSNVFKSLVLGILYRWKIENTMTDELMINCLEGIRVYLTRRRICRLTEGENVNIPSLCGRIAEINNQSDFLSQLSNFFYSLRLPNDIEIRQELNLRDFYNGLKGLSKFILLSMERVENNAIDFRDKRYVVEQIMPGRLNNQWKAHLGLEWETLHHRYANNIGNLVLTNLGNPMGSISFDDKKQKLTNHNLLGARLADVERWNEEAIRDHQRFMIDKFLEAFALPEKFRAAKNYNVPIENPPQDRPIIFPANVDGVVLATNNTPTRIFIRNVEYNVNTWREVYLKFLNYIANDQQNRFDTMVSTSIRNRDLNNVANFAQLQEIIQQDHQRSSWYKSLDGRTYRQVVNDPNRENFSFFRVHSSAEALLQKISNLMSGFEIGDNEVYVQL